jgi:hypothetical protein
MSTISSSEPGASPSVTELVSGIVGDVQNLGMQHLALFRHEIKADLQKATDAGASLAIGLAVAQLGGILLSLTLVYLLAEFAPQLPIWGCYGIVGTVISAVGALAIINGVQKMKSVDSLSKPALQVMKDDAEWLSNPK